MRENNWKVVRKSNIELLRIIAMLMIVAGHLWGQGFQGQSNNFINLCFGYTFGSASRIAVNLFLMIGVWFMVDTSFGGGKRIIKLWGTLWIYSVTITVCMFIFTSLVGIKSLLSAFFPFCRISLWFVTLYIVLILLSPWLYKILQWEKKRIQKLLLLLFVFVSGMCTISYYMDTYLCALVWFCFMYLFIGYYKKYGCKILQAKKEVFLGIAILIYVLLILTKIFSGISDGFMAEFIFQKVSQYCSDYKSIPNFIISLGIFKFFIEIDLGRKKLINFIASGAFGVYIIHQVPVFYSYLWSNIFRTNMWGDRVVFPILFIATVLVVYLCGLIIDYLRRLLLEPIWMKSGLAIYLCKRIDDFYQEII